MAQVWGALTELERHYLDTYGDPAPSFLDVVLNQKTLKATLNQTSLQATLNQETLSAVLNRET